jgi:DNA-binding IclR family transcriptional regulator
VEALAGMKREMSLTELAQQMQWPKGTVHGLLSTLRDYHYIEQSTETGRYRLGVRLFELGALAASRWDARAAAKPQMLQLNALLGETVHLATEDQGEVLYLEKIDSSHLLRIVSEVGIRLPMHCSGLGKVLLAYKTSAELRWIVSQRGLPPLTPHTITSLSLLERELAEIRRNGYGFDNGEVMEGLRCVAAPIRDANSRVRYAISVSGLASNIQGDRLEKIIAAVLEAARLISAGLGYHSLQNYIR